MQNTTIKDYHIQSELGRGGMATVYLAKHQLLQNQVAIKVLSQEYVRNENIRKRFLAEARNMASMSHPNIIKVTDLTDDGDTVAFVMEYIEGETLKEYIDRKGKSSDEEIKTIFSQILEAVGYVHEQSLVHRDIKPSNFMITPKGQIKLLDFGIAKNTDTQSVDYTQTGTTQNMGTPMYMSPEQIKSTKDVTIQSDIYSLGVVLWEMVMGKRPYDTNTISTFELQTKIVTEPLLKTNTNWDYIIQKATAKDIGNRCNNFMELRQILDNFINKRNNIDEDYTILSNTNYQIDADYNLFEKAFEVFGEEGENISALLEMKFPSPGESITELEIATWLVQDGDYVEKDQAIAEVDSDKATLELPAKSSGIITLKAKEGDNIAVGQVVCLIDTSAVAPADQTKLELTVPHGVIVVTMPRLSDTMTTGIVAKWLKKIGEKVNEGDILAEIETDKATMEFESFNEGTLLYVGVNEGESADVDAILAVIGPAGTDVSGVVAGFSPDAKSEESVAPSKPSFPLRPVSLLDEYSGNKRFFFYRYQLLSLLLRLIFYSMFFYSIILIFNYIDKRKLFRAYNYLMHLFE